MVGLVSPALSEDPPARVGALTVATGEVQYALDPEAGDRTRLDWSSADINDPVAQNMSIETGPMARATIRIGPDTIEMSAGTVLDVLNLTDRSIEAMVRCGRVFLHLHDIGNGENAEFEMPNGSFWLLENGGYDVLAGEKDEPSKVMVLNGEARAIGSDDEKDVAAGHEALLAGTFPVTVTTQRFGEPPLADTDLRQASIENPTPLPAVPAVKVQGPTAESAAGPQEALVAPPLSTATRQAVGPQPVAPAPNDVLPRPASSTPKAAPPAPAVSPQITGYDELAPYGAWQNIPPYGPVWFPYPQPLPADWAPYRYGHWASIAPWGWTWIDDQPWGFAPFHYGRWARIADRWGWIPGPSTATPVYAPALVAFVAPPDDDSDVGWVPLAPGEAYVPWFAADPAFLQDLNQGNDGGNDGSGSDQGGGAGSADGGNGGGGGGHARFANLMAATVMTRDAFARGETAGRHRLDVPRDRLAHFAVLRGDRLRIKPIVHTSFGGLRGPHSGLERTGRDIVSHGIERRGSGPGRDGRPSSYSRRGSYGGRRSAMGPRGDTRRRGYAGPRSYVRPSNFGPRAYQFHNSFQRMPAARPAFRAAPRSVPVRRKK